MNASHNSDFRITSLFGVLGLVFVGFLIEIHTVRAGGYYFSRELKVGSQGEDVRQLQILLNSDEDTQIQSTSVGSHGLESTYFGVLTKDAVVRFQEKYAHDILVPAGLDVATGYVGRATLKKLNDLSGGNASIPKTPSSVSQTPTTLSSSDRMKLLTTRINDVSSGMEQPTTTPNFKDTVHYYNPSVNQNQTNLEKFEKSLDRLAAKKNIPSDLIEKFKAEAVIQAATSSDLRKSFIEQIQKKSVTEIEKGSLFGQIFFKVSQTLAKILEPKPVLAAGTGVPFGGALIYPFFCTCSYNYLIFLEPLPPTEVEELSYTPFTQLYLSYNIPYTTELLGFYTPSGGTCSIYYGYGCATIYTEGNIQPTVGSSPE